jgi:hypothetical protein
MSRSDKHLTRVLTTACASFAKVRAFAGTASRSCVDARAQAGLQPAYMGDQMSRIRISQPGGMEVVRGRITLRGVGRHLTAVALLLALAPSPAHAQFGMLKKLKNKVSAPDSAARAKDSLEQIARGVSPDSVKIGKGLLARGVSAASAASNKLEETTGISAKDAALAATGVGASALVAKKMGMDPGSMKDAIVNNAKANANAKMMQKANGVNAMGAIPGMGDMAAMGAAQARMMEAARKGGAGRPTVGGGVPTIASMGMTGTPNMAGMAGYTEADAQAIVAFQQEMMQVAMAASAGDAGAKARLEAWQTLTLKHEAEIQKLSLQAQGGDAAAIQKLQQMQFTIMKEWASTGSVMSKLPKAKRP